MDATYDLYLDLMMRSLVDWLHDDFDERVGTVATSYGGTAGPQVVSTYDPASRIITANRTIGISGSNADGSVHTSFRYDAADRETGIIDQATTYSSGGVTARNYQSCRVW